MAPLSERITACAEKLTSFGLLEGSKYNLDVLHDEIQSLVPRQEMYNTMSVIKDKLKKVVKWQFYEMPF